VNGWYDEVADFNASYVDPFFAPPGILVGHFTQLVWAQAWKIGCGRIVYKPEGKKRFENLFICNYGLAGNLIGSQMYKIGAPCSACPSGTSCSGDYPGLCLGIPDKPLRIRRPFPLPKELLELSGKPDSFGSTKFVTLPREPPKPTNSSCIHNCKLNGGCSVKLNPGGNVISGPILGSCFPPDFGGSCSGIPDLCTSCDVVCAEHGSGMEVVVHYSPEGEQLEMIDVRPLPTAQTSSGTANGIPSRPLKFRPLQQNQGEDDATCKYNCKENGGCNVKIEASFPISGFTSGSCFPPDFGGECSGIPQRCDNCGKKCKNKTGEIFSIKANPN